MKWHILTVNDVASVIGRGVILFPGLQLENDQVIRVGDPVILRKPDGCKTTEKIGGFEFPSPNPHKWVLLFFEGLDKDDVPVGTEVWSVDRTSAGETTKS